MLDFLRFENMKPAYDVKALPKIEIADFEKYEYGVKMGIFNATSVQVDGGDYGSRTKSRLRTLRFLKNSFSQ